jgi:Arc/MetJ family transcription regulator
MESMKTTVDIPTEALEEAMRHSGAKTKREAVVTAIRDYNRRQRVARLIARFGTFDGVMTQAELRRMREVRHQL